MTIRQQAWRGGAAAVAVLLLLAGCSGTDGDDSAAESSGQGGAVADNPAGAVDEDAAGEAAAEGDTGGSSLAVDTLALARTRDVIRIGEMWITVDRVESANDAVRTIAGDAEGFVSDEQVRAGDHESDVTVRVPAADFDDVRDQIAELGDVHEQRVEAQDVTAEMVDVETRIGSLRASVERLQGLLGGAGDVAQLAAVEGELASRETELEALLGQQRVLRDQVDLATLTVHLSEDEGPEPSENAAGFSDGLRQGWVTAVDVGRALLAVLGFTLPFLPLAALGLLAYRWWSRRHRAVAAPSAAPASSP